MGTWQALRRAVSPQLRRAEMWREAEEEMRQHVELEAADLMRQGVPAEEARRRARLAFGSVEAAREEAWESRSPRWLEDLGRDLRYALRSLRRSPGFTVMAVGCLALGLGVTTTIVGVADAVMLRPLPYPDADELVAVYAANPARGLSGVNISRPDYESWRDTSRSFEQLGMWTWSSLTISGGGEAERVETADVTPNLFPLLGVSPALGRGFAPDEDRSGKDRVLLLSWALWQRRFGGDRGIVGRAVTVDGNPYTVVGVMPERFAFPQSGQAWRPLAPEPEHDTHGNRFYAAALGRLRDGVGFAAAQAEMARISTDLQRAWPEDNLGWEAELVPLREDLLGDLRGPLLVFLAAVCCVLLITCANVANLLLVRGAARGRELAVRAAIGAGRGRVVRQLLAESLAIALVGAALGGALAFGGVRLAERAFPDGLPFFLDLGLDARVIGFLAMLALVTAALSGVLPALRGGDLRLTGSLRDGSPAAGDGVRRARARAALVTAEIALSLVLMTGAGLLIRSYRSLAHTELGFEPRGVLSFRVTLPEVSYPETASRSAFYATLLARLRTLPGVASAGSAQGTPASGWNVQGSVEVAGRPPAPRDEEVDSHFQSVMPGFFATLQVPLLRGRAFADADRNADAPVVIVNESFARTFFPGRDAVGQRVRPGGADGTEPWATIVGVVADYRHYRLPEPMGPALYYPYHVWQARTQTVVLRTGLDDPRALLPAVTDVLRQLDPEVPPYQVQTLDEVMASTLWRQRLQGQALGTFATLALLLAAVGLYGVVASTVAQRRREIGVRVALGATRRQVVRSVVQQGARLMLRGVAIGLVAALGLVRLLGGLLHGVQPYDPATFVGIPLLLAAVALLASWLPALAAARVEPLVTLRGE